MKTINRSGEHLLALINDILDMSKIEAGRATLNENDFDLYHLLDDLNVMLQAKAKAKRLQMVFDLASDVPQFIHTDESKLCQVLINLLGNAIKFTAQGRVTLNVSCRFPQVNPAGQLVLGFEVEDTGPGIASQDISTLFQAFTQTETGLQAREGTGLGLPISQKFVRLMGGEIAVESEVGRGSRLAFEILVVRVDRIEGDRFALPPARTAIGLAPNQQGYRILAVEDRWENRQLLVKLLTSIGFEVAEATNGREAIEVWQRWQPHLIWMDMQMPVMDGYEATEYIKADEKGQKTVIIALTASAFEEQRQEILSVGCDDFVRKPFREAELLDKINQHLGVQYLYAENVEEKAYSAGESSQILDASALQVMPTEWIEQLHYAASQCSDFLILKLLEQIPQENTVLVKGLTELVNNFQFARVMELAKPDEPSSFNSND